jgi:D-alanyl-D-alanine carboxypeptidase/D-alanyl-D-alanine-endopeptidase (penicillin-binding protein 4)
VREALEELGVDPAGLVQVDGSGLSRENRARAEQLVALLEAVLRGDPASADAFLSSLAVAGETGTLEDRMGGIAGRVRAKTGWIAGASALSGFASTDGGETIAFSILVEYPMVGGLNTSCWKPMQDGICKVLVEEGS